MAHTSRPMMQVPHWGHSIQQLFGRSAQFRAAGNLTLRPACRSSTCNSLYGGDPSLATPFRASKPLSLSSSVSALAVVLSQLQQWQRIAPPPASDQMLSTPQRDEVEERDKAKAMLENEMEESRSGTIKISDVSYDALQAFINYLCSAESCLDEQMPRELLVLAEKYQVEHLKAYCEKFLVSKLNWDKSIIYYAFAHQHNAKLLLEAALSLILDNMDKLIKREEYSEFVGKHPTLVIEIYEAYLAKQENTAVEPGTRSTLPGTRPNWPVRFSVRVIRYAQD